MLPAKQKEILDFINGYNKEQGFTPTLEEIATHFKRSIPTIHQHVTSLRTKGYLKMVGVNARSIAVFNNDSEISEIPLLGTISAGSGIENIEVPESIKVQKSLLSSVGSHFALTVQGTSMIEDSILPDDIIIVKAQNHADNGDVVVALIQKEDEVVATVKRFFLSGSKVELRPRNPLLKTQTYPMGEIEIRGKFMGLIRKA